MSSSNPRRRSPGARSGAESQTQNGLPLQIMSALRKGATFHSPTSPSDPINGFAPPRLTRAQSDFDEFTNANCRRIALALNEFDEVLARAGLASHGCKTTTSLQDTSLPIPGLLLDLPVVDPAAMEPSQERRVLRPRSVRNKSRVHASDSGIGSSIASSTEKCEAVETATKRAKPLPSAATRLAASSGTGLLPSLSARAADRIYEHILQPLLAKGSLEDFKPIVLEMPRRIQSDDIKCLRDLEKALCSMAPEKAKTADLYLDFCLTSVRCIQATVEYIPDREQIRPGDRPYTNGYFIDLKDQLYNYGRQLAAVQEKGDIVPNDDLAFDQSDEIRLHGGIAENGRPAELVRVKKDGTAISMATGKVVDLNESPAQLKRSLSEQLEDEEEIMRSMARRKKNASPEELAPKRCREPGCTKEFKRPCDLTKHEKTHSRPWKCPFATCKYHDYGWPTEKEMDRHINDKHSDAPAMYECLFKPCPYKSKRESNCKQHMEKAHGWVYVRTKTNGKKQPSNSADSLQQTPLLGNLSIPSATPSSSVPTPPQESAHQAMPHDFSHDFPHFPNDSDWLATYGHQPQTLDLMDLGLENPSPASATSYEQYPPYQNGSAFITDDDIYAAHVQIVTQQMPTPEPLYEKMMPQQMPIYPQQQQQHCMMAPVATLPLESQTKFSPAGQQNAVLYTPTSLREVDEGFDDCHGSDGSDFQLYPAEVAKAHFNPLFGDFPAMEAPSANLGFSQTYQDVFQQMGFYGLDGHATYE